MVGYEFVNRDRYIKTVQQILEDLSHKGNLPRPVFVNLVGISGIGKTTLLRKFQTICESHAPPFFSPYIDLLRISSCTLKSASSSKQTYVTQIEILQVLVSALHITLPADSYYLDQILDDLRHYAESVSPEATVERRIREATQEIISKVTAQKGILFFDAVERAKPSLIAWLEERLWRPILKKSTGLAIFVGGRRTVQISDDFLKSEVKIRELECLNQLDSIALSRQICPKCAELIFQITRGFPLLDVIVAEALQQMEVELELTIDESNFSSHVSRLLSQYVRPLIERRILGHTSEETKRLYRQMSPVRTFDVDLVPHLSPILGLPKSGVGPTMIAAQLERTGLISWQRGRAYVSNHIVRRPTAMDLKLHKPDLFLKITNTLVDYHAEKMKKEANRIDPGASVCEWAYHRTHQGLVNGESVEHIERIIGDEIINQIHQTARKSAVTDAILRDLEDDWELLSMFEDDGVSLIQRIRAQREIQKASVNKDVTHLSILVDNIDGSGNQRIIAVLNHKDSASAILDEKIVSGTVIQMIMRQYYDIINKMSRDYHLLDEKRLRMFEKELAVVGKLFYTRLLKREMQEAVSGAIQGNSLVVTANRPDIPWEILHDQDGFLSLRFPFSRKDTSPPSIRSSEQKTFEIKDALIIADPTSDLPQTLDEVEFLRGLLNQCRTDVKLLMGEEANYLEVSKCLLEGSYDLVHFAGHAVYRRGSTSRTGLVLANHEILSVEDIVSSGLKGAPAVFLNACEAAKSETSSVLATYTPRFAASLTSSFIRAGARACLGSAMHIPDESAAWFSRSIYSQFIGQRVPLGTAVRQVRKQAQSERRVADWLLYVLYGDPDICCENGSDSIQ